MPSVIFSDDALQDLKRLRVFLRSKNPAAAREAAGAILKSLQILTDYPEIARPVDVDDRQVLHELPITFGRDGYVALYRQVAGTVIVIAIRHGRGRDIDRHPLQAISFGAGTG